MTFIMKKLILVPVLAAAAGAGFAQEFGQVLSATPIIQKVGVPRQVCTNEQVQLTPPKSGAGAAMGAIAGGALANAVAHGPGQAAATMIGIIGGAVIGDRIEGPATAQVQNVQRCATQTFYENRTVAYSVVYEYAGKHYAVQMPQDPGPTLQLQVTPVGSAATATATDNYLAQGQVIDAQAGQVLVMQPGYPVYAAQPYYPPISLSLGLGYWSGFRGHGYWR
jgi:uncharacterized protein YcfJ